MAITLCNKRSQKNCLTSIIGSCYWIPVPRGWWCHSLRRSLYESLSHTSQIREGTVFIGGGGGGSGLGFHKGGSSVKFWSNGGGSRLLDLWKLGEGHAFSYRKYGSMPPDLTSFRILPRSRYPYLTWFHMRLSLRGSPHAHFPLSIPDESFPIWTGYSENELARYSHLFKNIWSTPQHSLSELKWTEVCFLTKLWM